MPNTNLLSQLQDAADQASIKAGEYSGTIETIKTWIVDNFGQNGLVAAMVLATVMVLLVVGKLAKITFSTMKFVVIPAIALAFLATMFLGVSFVVALPASATVCSLFLLFKG
jgi:hypothetical protein